MSACPPPCLPVDRCIEDLDRYSLQDPTFFFVLNCPPGFFCGGSDQIIMVCCDGSSNSAAIPPGTSAADRQSIIDGLVTQCLQKQLFCNPPPPKDPPIGPINPVQLYYNRPQCCASPCPDGNMFNSCVPSGVVIPFDQATADALAKQIACQNATKNRICLGEIQRCTCANQPYQATVKVTGASAASVKLTVVNGSLPTGLTVSGKTISGTPTAGGTSVFTLRASDPSGNNMDKTYTIVVLEITTTSLPSYTLGQPYNFQMQVTGGSGNYAWKITSGNFPDGISMDLAGIISGTPTADNGTPLTFLVIDQDCEGIDRSFFPPKVSVKGVSSTKIKTFRGYPEYQVTTGNLYRHIDWTGQIGQQGRTIPESSNGFADLPLGGAYWSYSGFDEIDIFGNFVSTHTRNRFQACGTTLFQSNLAIPPFSSNLFHGYCFNGDPICSSSCQPCITDPMGWPLFGNDASTSQFDLPPMILGNVVMTPTTLSAQTLSSLGVLTNPGGPAPVFPKATLNGHFDTWAATGGIPSLTNQVSATLSVPYTDADAEASAQIIAGHSLTAENFPNNRNYNVGPIANRESKTTGVTYALHCANLLLGEIYNASITLRDSDGTSTTLIINFTANATTHDITGGIPDPLPGHTTTAVNPRINFAT